MKKLILFIVVLSGIAFYACSKKEVDQKEKKVETSKLDVAAISAISIDGPIIIIRAKPYRAVAANKKGKSCGCLACFGICDIHLGGGVDYTDGVIVPDLAINKARVYFLENLANFESEFAIDQNINIPPAALNGTGINNMNLLLGEYSFQSVTDTLIHNSTSYISYGFVDIDISHN